VWADSSRQPDQLNNDFDDDIAPLASHSSQLKQQPMSGRAFRKIAPVEEETTPENSSVNVDIFTKPTTDPATGDIIRVKLLWT